VEPAFRGPERPSKLDPYAEKLSAWLKTEAGKSRKGRRTLKQIHAVLVALGYEGSYNRVAAFARRWKADRQREQQTAGRGTFVTLVFEPGEAFQYDSSEDSANVAGENTKLQVAHIKLSHSRRRRDRRTMDDDRQVWSAMALCRWPLGLRQPGNERADFVGLTQKIVAVGRRY
jgi:hypothetical protein